MTGLEDDTYSNSNSLGIKMTKIEAGELSLGFEGSTLPEALIGRETHRQNGDFDEHLAHKVSGLSRSKVGSNLGRPEKNIKR